MKLFKILNSRRLQGKILLPYFQVGKQKFTLYYCNNEWKAVLFFTRLVTFLKIYCQVMYYYNN